jgi:tetratricopeptide (TPR) repeat protein
VQHRAGLFEKALQVSDELLSHGHRTGELLNLRGWIFNKMHQPQEARKSLELAIAAEPDNADHCLDLSTVLKDSGERESALRLLSDGIERNAQPDRLQVQIGLLYQESGKNEEAEKWYRRVLQAKPNAPAYLALAHLLSATNRSGEARRLFENAIQNLPSDPLVHFMYGVHLLSSAQDSEPDQIEKAGLVLNKALALNPLYANIHYWLGKFFLRKGNVDSAKACFEKACTLDPKHANSYYQLSRIALQRGEREKAENLAGILRKLHHDAQEREQETFADLVQDSLRGKVGLSPVAAK